MMPFNANDAVVICFQISIFAESYTPVWGFHITSLFVVICFQISIFAESYTPRHFNSDESILLWFAFKLVSLQSHIHPGRWAIQHLLVVICFQISIFAESYTPGESELVTLDVLWFAFKLVSLQSHIHPKRQQPQPVLCCDLLSN